MLLYLDEIQYFNKKQQQSLLEFMENGKITLIASTTENPFFYVFGAVLSRSTVFEFKQITAEDALPAIDRGVDLLNERLGGNLVLEDGVGRGAGAHRLRLRRGHPQGHERPGAALLRRPAGGRKAADFLRGRPDRSTKIRHALRPGGGQPLRHRLRPDEVVTGVRPGRGGPDAAVHYLARLLEAGDLITAIRRLLCSASEDVGLAYPQAVPIVKACVDSALQLGLPEAKLPLSEAAILLATWPKSNTACMAIDAALADVKAGRTGDIPRELQNVHADSAGQEREQGYLYPHNFPNHWVRQQYLPTELKNRRYYQYGDNKTEQAARRYWEEIKK